MSKGSRSKPLRVGATGRRVIPGRRAVLEKQRPISAQYTVWFDGPNATRAFSSLVDALSPCSYKLRLTGDHYEISFDTTSANQRKCAEKLRPMKRAAK